MKRYYIAYGSNLNIAQMKRRCPTATIIATANLKGYELLFKGSLTGSYLTIEKNERSSVPVAIWEVNPTDELALDRYEGYPNFYYKQNIKLNCKDIHTGEIKEIMAFAYIMHEDRPIGIPSEFYLRTCIYGYEAFGFDKRVLMRAYEKCRRIVENGG